MGGTAHHLVRFGRGAGLIAWFGRRSASRATGLVAATAASAVVAGLLTAVPVAAAASQRTIDIDTVSVLPDGTSSSTTEINPSVSANGRYVGFIGSANCFGGGGFYGALRSASLSSTALSSADTAPACYSSDAFVRDRQAGTTTLISHLPSDPTVGVGDNNYGSDVNDIAISGDGSEVAFTTDVDGVVAADTNGLNDVFVADRATAAVHPVVVPDLGAPYNGVEYQVGLSMDGNGTQLAYVVQDTNFEDHLVVEDWRAGTGVVVPLPAGTSTVDEPELSADGSRVAFVINAGASDSHVVVVDLADPSTPLLDRSMGEPQYYGYTGRTYAPRISLSADGRFLAYPQPASPGLAPIAVQDLSSLATPPVVLANPVASSCDPNTQACYDLGAPALSADGNTIVFDPMSPSGTHELYKASPINATATPISVLPDGSLDTQYPGDRTPAITADGTGVVFQSNNATMTSTASGSDADYAHDPNGVAPSFAVGAALVADNLTGTQVRLTWPAATDDHVVIGYRLTRDGVTIADLDPSVTSFTVAGLTGGTTYHFAVSGVDAALNIGTPLTLAVTTSGGSGGGSTPGEAPLAVDASAGGGHATVSWDPSSDAGVTGYRVMRSTSQSGPFTQAGSDVAAPATTFTDSGLDAETTYWYRVDELTAAGAQPYTKVASGTTPAINVASVSVTAPRVDGANAVPLGSDLTITVHGEANRAGTATVDYSKPDGTAGSSDVALTETAPDSGVYIGTFTMAQGIASLTAISATLADNAGHSATGNASGLPLGVSGSLTVTIDQPAGGGSITGAKLTVLSSSVNSGAQQTVDGGQSVTLALAAANDYTLTLTLPDGFKAATLNDVSVPAGGTASIDVQPLTSASVTVKVLDPDGAPASGVRVDLYQDGNFIGTHDVSASAAGQVVFDDVAAIASSSVVVDATLDDQTAKLLGHYSVPVTLQPGDNEVTVTEQALPTAAIHGTLSVQGVPTAGSVFASVFADGRKWSFATTTADGHYTLPILAGTVFLRANESGAVPTNETLYVRPGADMEVDTNSNTLTTFHLDLSATAHEFDGTSTPVSLDPSTAAHLRFSLSGPNGFSTNRPSATVNIAAAPGDTFTFCLDGREVGLTSNCTSGTVQVGETSLPLHIDLSSAGEVDASLLGTDGQPFTGTWHAHVYPVNASGIGQPSTTSGAGSDLEVAVPSAGEYEVVVDDTATYPYAKTRPVTVTVAQGAIAQLGSLVFAARNPDFGNDGNEVLAVQPQVAPGQAAQFRATYTYSGSSAVPATIKLGVPAGTTLVADSVTLDGAPVSGSLVDGSYDVDLGTLSHDQSGTLYYTVETAPGTPQGPATSIVIVQYGASSEALIGSAATMISGVSLAAPSKIVTTDAVVSGHAPAGATVDVFDDDGDQVGQAIATDGGLWQATVHLADRGEGHVYGLRAQTTFGGQLLTSGTSYVTYDSHLQLPESIVMAGPEGQVVSFDPRFGVARFPFVFTSGTYSFAVSFAHPERIHNLKIRVGDTAQAVSAGSVNVNLSLTSKDLGPVFLDYDESPAPYSLSDFQMPTSAQEAGEQMPDPMAHFTGGAVSGGTGGSTVTAGLPDYGAALSMSGSVTPVAYAPTAQDLSTADAVGMPLYDLQVDSHLEGDDLVFSVGMVVSQSFLDSAAGAALTSSGPLHGAALRLAPASPETNVAIQLTGKILGAGAAAGAGTALWDALHAGQPYQVLSGLLGALNGCADPGIVSADTDYLNGVADKIAGLQAAKGAVFAFGFLGGFETLGVSALVGLAVNYGLGKVLQSDLNDAVDKVNSDLNSPECQRHRDKKVADPDWDIDPSGFTYEAVTSNRLSGVTATLLQSDSPDGPFQVWDAAAYGQANPQTTDSAGKYGWFVPTGYWKVAYTKPGYETAYSQVYRIPPPRFDVNVGLTRLAAPTVALTRATSGTASSVTVGFDDYMKVDSVTGRINVTDTGGNAVSGTVTPVDAQAAPDGTMLAKTFRFVPDAPFAAGATLTLGVDELVRDYADHTLDAGFSTQLTAVAPVAPAAPGNVQAAANDASSITATWTAPSDDGGSPVTGYHVSVSPGVQTVDVAADARSATVSGLAPSTAYTITVAATNEAGTGTAATTAVTTPSLTLAEAFGPTHLPTSIAGGTTAQGDVSLGAPAPAGDVILTLASDDPTLAGVPTTISVDAGQTDATFAITTTNPLMDTTVRITITRDTVSETIPVVVTHVPTPLTATPSLGTVTLGWTAASDSNVTGYRIMRVLGDGDFAQVADVDAATTSYADTGLAPGTTYRYQVFALLANGAAVPWSQIAEATTPRIPVTLTVSSSPSGPVYGQDVTIGVATTPAEAGVTVTVSEGDTVLGSAVTGDDGVAHIVVPGLPVGLHTLTITYPGDHATLPTSATATVTVAKAATTLTIDRVPLGQLILDLLFHRLAVTAHLTRSWDGAPIAGEQVTIDSWKGEVCVATTDAAGVASCPLPRRMLGAALLGVLHASFAGSANYLPSEYGTVAPPGWSHRGPDGDRGPGKGHDTEG